MKNIDEKNLENVSGGTFTVLSMNDEQQSKDSDGKGIDEALHDMLSGSDSSEKLLARVGYSDGKRGQAKVRKV